MSRRRSFVPQKRPVFIGCEGDSEVGYVGVLQDLAMDANLAVHLRAVSLGRGAGDPWSRVELAITRLEHLRRTRIEPRDRFAFLDKDQADRDPARAAQAIRLAAEHNISIIWQEPCFEALLLRHLPDRAGNRPPDNAATRRAIERDWPEYRKPMSRVDLARRIDMEAIMRAATVEPELASLLRCIGLLRA